MVNIIIKKCHYWSENVLPYVLVAAGVELALFMEFTFYLFFPFSRPYLSPGKGCHFFILPDWDKT